MPSRGVWGNWWEKGTIRHPPSGAHSVSLYLIQFLCVPPFIFYFQLNLHDVCVRCIKCAQLGSYPFPPVFYASIFLRRIGLDWLWLKLTQNEMIRRLKRRIKCIEEGRSFLHYRSHFALEPTLVVCYTHAGGGPLTVTAKLTGPWTSFFISIKNEKPTDIYIKPRPGNMLCVCTSNHSSFFFRTWMCKNGATKSKNFSPIILGWHF